MCGIVAVYSYHPKARKINKDEVITIRDFMSNRGPDGKGLWCSDNQRIALAHRRLAVIDTSDTGHQPMLSHDERFCISFNGEIYNYQELKSTLIHKGYHFSGNSDTEVLLRLYEDKQEAMLPLLRGMFALVIWDQKQQSLFMARDCYGIKPLYYADNGHTIRVASQVKALSQCQAISDKKDPAGVIGYFLLGSVPEPYTIYEDIKSLPAGSFLKITSSGMQKIIQWQSISHLFHQAENLSHKYDKKTLKKKFEEAFFDSAQHHLVSDVPVGIFLSAGIDSSSLLGLISSSNSGQSSYESVSIGFDQFKNTHNDEIPLASKVAEHYQSTHHPHYISEADFHQELPKFLDWMDQPSLDGINMWFACRAAKQHGFKVMLSGVGGDELLAGYPSFKDIPKLRRWFDKIAHIPKLGRSISAIGNLPIIDHFSARFFSRKLWYIAEYASSNAGVWLLRRGIFMPQQLDTIFPPDILKEGLEKLRIIPHIQSSEKHKLESNYANIAVLESEFYMRNQLLRDMDWVSMSFSIETRTPFIDTQLTPYIAALLMKKPESSGKNLLAETATKSPKLRKILTNRAKTGFVTPIHQWVESDKLLKSYTKDGCPIPKSKHWSQLYTYILGRHFLNDVMI